MFLIALGAVIFAAGVAMVSPSGGVMVLGLVVAAVGVYRDLSTPDDPTPPPAAEAGP